MILSMDYDFKMRMSHMGECYLHIHNTKHFMLFDVHIDHLPRKKVIYICPLSIFTSACPLRALLPFTHTHRAFNDFKGSLVHKGETHRG